MVKSTNQQERDVTHAEKLVKSAKDTRDIFLLLLFLLIIVSVWNIWTRARVSELKEIVAVQDSNRKKLDRIVTPGVAHHLYEPPEESGGSVDLRRYIQNIFSNLNVVRNEKKRIQLPKKDILTNTHHEYIVVSEIKNIELDRLVHLLVAVRGPQDNIWCTEIEKLEPTLDEGKFAVVTTKGDPVYSIKSMRFSRFTEMMEP